MTPLEIAITQIGAEETPRGSNWGEPVRSYLAAVGIGFPASWCMAFVYWCFVRSAEAGGPPNLLIRTGGVLRQWHEIPAKYKLTAHSRPEPGDIFIMDHGHGLGHTGFVESYVQSIGEIITIEGNTNDTGSREGYQVCRRRRPVRTIAGFIRIPGAAPAAPIT